MIVVSLLLNIAVLIAVSIALVNDADWTRTAYGARTPARDILFAVYLAILVGSALLLVGVIAAPAPALHGAVAALLALQIFYKIGSAATVSGALRNPVVLSNLGIAAVHLTTVITLVLGVTVV